MDLGRVKLRPVGVVTKQQHHTQVPQVSHTDIESYNQRVRQCDLDQWLERAAPFTFPTFLIPFSVAEGAALLECCKKKSAASVPPSLLSRLNQVIHEKLQKDGAFVKLSSRSAKDSTVSGQRTRDLFRRFVAEEESRKKSSSSSQGADGNLDDNDLLICINRAHIDALKVDSAEDAFFLLVNSERILDDLDLALEHSKVSWNQHIVVRQWIQCPLQREFRGFVFRARLTALSQYYVPCFFPELQQHDWRQRVLQEIEVFFKQVVDCLPLDNANQCCVVDFCVLDHDDDNNKKKKLKCYLIEVNPFNDYEGCGTSASLFDWKKDSSLLRGEENNNNENKIHFRWQEKKEDNILQLVGTAWRDEFKSVTK